MFTMKNERKCIECKKILVGRADKRFCDPYCKSAYHYKKAQSETPKFYIKVQQQLKLNRKILKNYNKAGKATVRIEVLLEQGFNPNFFTHYWKNQRGNIYLFVYEYGFLKRKEKTKDKFVLIKWQEYMEKGKFGY